MNDFDMVTRNVVLEKRDEEIARELAKRNGYGPRGFSIALRQIIREWWRLTQQVDSRPEPPPTDRA